MAVRFADQILSPRWQRHPATIAAELEATATLANEAERASRRTLLAIERRFAEANELFNQRRYREAVQAYIETRSQIYRLLDRRHNPEAVVAGSFAFPVNPELLDLMLEAAVQTVQPLLPRPPAPQFNSDLVLPDDLREVFKQADNAGLKADPRISDEVIRLSDAAQAAAKRGAWRQAVELFAKAEGGLGQGDSEAEAHARAALRLNQGAALALADDLGGAEELLRAAEEGFQGLGDIGGSAQAQANLATTFRMQGRHDEAERALAQAQDLLRNQLRIPLVDGKLAPGVTDALDPAALVSASQLAGTQITFRSPAKGEGWALQVLESPVVTGEAQAIKRVGYLIGQDVTIVDWAGDTGQISQRLRQQLYETRVGLADLDQITGRYVEPADFAGRLPQLYNYAIPVSLGDCYHALGDFTRAERHYLEAADYQFLNLPIEAPALWRKIAQNRLEWGDDLYRQDEFQEALDVFRQVVEPPGGAGPTPAGAPLYSHVRLRPTGDLVTQFLGDTDQRPDGLSPQTAAVVLEIFARVLQLDAGLDFFGMPASIVPIWTFDYLQSVARYFAQAAIQAERDYINFQDRADQATFTRTQLVESVKVAEAEAEVARLQSIATDEEVDVYRAGVDLAVTRQDNAQAARDQYAATSELRIFYDAALTALGAGSDAIASELDRYATQLERGGSISGERGVVSGAVAMARGRLTAEYELASMDRQITELAQAETFARAQQTAAEARAAAARAMAMAAGQRTEAAAANLAAFDDQTFTADVWAELAGFMRHISRLQLYRGTRIARLMQQAYNFENDVNRRIIRADYTTAGAAGLLGADALARDIDAFTFDLVTTRRQKEMPLTYTLSLAGMFPFLFETTFRNTGTISFQTRIEDIDRIAPGTYARRIERVEVAVEGLLPRGGARGVLTNGGISFYRTPRIDDVRVRVQPSESLILSEHDLRRDALIFRNDERTRGIFEGAGIASTWTLELPKIVNDLNYETITDVRITFYAMARYHSALAVAVQNQLSTVPGLLRRTRTLPLRWLHPDAFFRFQDTGRLEFALTPVDDFGFDEQDPQIVQIGVLFKTVAGTDPTPWQVRLATSEHGESPPASPNAAGEITVEAGHPWEAAANGAALGEWAIVLRPEENAPLVSDGRLDLSAIQNTVLLLDYTYTARA